MVGFECMDCPVNTAEIHEYYTVWDEVWLKAHPDDFGILCVGCLEKRLGRLLTPADFPDYAINDRHTFQKSGRLMNRMGYDEQKEVDVP